RRFNGRCAMCTVSVIIPTYNRALLLRRAIESAVTQGSVVGQIIVVDDGSTDRTAEVCQQYSDRVTYIWQPNSGASAARNNGVARADFPWVAFLDSDDYWTPSHLKRIALAINRTEGAARFYFSDMQIGFADVRTSVWTIAGFAPPREIFMTADGTNWSFLS